MKVLKVMGPILVIMLFLLPLHAGAEGLGNARISMLDGDVQIKPEDSSEWLPASINMPLREGDSIWVPDNGKTEVQMSDGSQVRLAERSSLEILNMERDSSQFYLTIGSAYVNFRAGRGRLVQIDTPISSVRSYDRSAFGVDVAENGDTDVSVYKGSVDAESQSGRTVVQSGRMLSIGGDYADLAPLGRSDDWEQWNMDRDRRFEERRYTSTQYLPEELNTYSGDFDDNGRWVQVREYGYVWTPTVSVSVGWSPYSHGRWAWIGGDYVWVGYEPWGWAPYHYGRWAFGASVGWFWVPPARGAVYWGPGYVGWVSTPTYVAWVPLAPGEIYYGHGNYGPHSVNIVNVNVNKIVVKNVYKNVYVNNGVTVVHHDTFVKGRKVDFRHTENPFLKEKVSIGRPNIKPERETRMSVVREIPRAKEPPQRIKEVKVRELKEKRPLIKEKSKSVLSPREPRKELKVKTFDAPKERKKGRPEGRAVEKDEKGRPAERQRPEERKVVPEKKVAPEKKVTPEDRGGRIRDRKDVKPKDRDKGPEAQPAERPAEKRKERRIEPKDEKQPEKLPQRQKPSQLEQREQQQQEEKKLDRPGKNDVRPPADREPAQRVRPADREPVPDKQMQREKPRRPDTGEGAEKQRKQEQLEKQKKQEQLEKQKKQEQLEKQKKQEQLEKQKKQEQLEKRKKQLERDETPRGEGEPQGPGAGGPRGGR